MQTRKNIMLGTAGHVDHGKTAVVRMLTGCDTDTLAEEKQRGLTIDLGFAPCRLANERIVGVVDVPGHVDFIRNMVAGAHGIDVVIFVVAADDSVMPQTREHLDILTLMGVRGGIVAMTKIDLVDADMRQVVADDIRSLLAGTFLEHAPICGISNITGEGYDAFLDALNAAVETCEARPTDALMRMWIEDVFSIHGFGTVVTGIPSAGEVRVGQHVRLLPGERTGRVRKLQVYGQDAEVGRCGECIAMNLADADLKDVGRGMVVCEADATTATMVEAELRLLAHTAAVLKDYAEVHLHVGTAQTMAHVAMLESKLLAPGERQFVQLRLREPLPLAPGERFVIRTSAHGVGSGQMTTIGGGRIVGTSGLRLRRNRPWTLAELTDRRDALDDERAWLDLHLRLAARVMTPRELAAACGLPEAKASAVLAELSVKGQALACGDGFVHRRIIDGVQAAIIETMEAFHKGNPMRAGVGQSELPAMLAAPAVRGVGVSPARAEGILPSVSSSYAAAAASNEGRKAVAREETPQGRDAPDTHGQDAHATFGPVSAVMLGLAVDGLIAAGELEHRGEVLAMKGRGARLSAADEALCGKVTAAYVAAHLTPPGQVELATTLGITEGKCGTIIRLLADRGELVALDDKIIMHRDAVAVGEKVAIELFSARGGFETVDFRDALGVSRKFAVPLLDYFDTVRLTVRSGSRRTPGAAAKARLNPAPG